MNKFNNTNTKLRSWGRGGIVIAGKDIGKKGNIKKNNEKSNNKGNCFGDKYGQETYQTQSSNGNRWW